MIPWYYGKSIMNLFVDSIDHSRIDKKITIIFMTGFVCTRNLRVLSLQFPYLLLSFPSKFPLWSHCPSGLRTLLLQSLQFRQNSSLTCYCSLHWLFSVFSSVLLTGDVNIIPPVYRLSVFKISPQNWIWCRWHQPQNPKRVDGKSYVGVKEFSRTRSQR